MAVTLASDSHSPRMVYGMEVTPRAEEFRLRFEPLRGSLVPYEFPATHLGTLTWTLATIQHVCNTSMCVR